MAPPAKPSPVPVPSAESIPLSRVVFSSSREREVRQLIHDLAVWPQGKNRQCNRELSSMHSLESGTNSCPEGH